MELYSLTNITANPFKEKEIFKTQKNKRVEELINLFTNYTAIKLNYNNSNRFDIISPSINQKGIRVTWFDGNVILGHKDIEKINDIITDYLKTNISISELI